MRSLHLEVYPDPNGYYGQFGGNHYPLEAHEALQGLADKYEELRHSPDFNRTLNKVRTGLQGRPTPIHHLENISSEIGGAQIYVKREDLNHTGAHKINHCVGFALLAKAMGKQKLIAETGAGQHGVALATAAAYFGLECEIHMGAVDTEKQKSNVGRMQILGAKVVAATAGQSALKEASDSAFDAYIEQQEHALYAIGSAIGPHPFPLIVRDFQSVIGREAREQFLAITDGTLPDHVVACVAGGSNAMGMYSSFIDDVDVALHAVEPLGTSNRLGEHAATLSYGKPGTLHGAKTLVLQHDEGVPASVSSIASGLVYPGIGPEMAMLHQAERLSVSTVGDAEVIMTFFRVAKKEGIIIALEKPKRVTNTSAFAYVFNLPKTPRNLLGFLSPNTLCLVPGSLSDMPQRSFIHHLTCISETRGNNGGFPLLWVGENAPAQQRREYMYAFLLWMREGTFLQLQELESPGTTTSISCCVRAKPEALACLADTSPTPQYPWDYSGPRYQFFQEFIMHHRSLFRFLLSELNSELPVLLALTDQPSTALSLIPHFQSNPSESVSQPTTEIHGQPITPFPSPKNNNTVASHHGDSFDPDVWPELNDIKEDHASPYRSEPSSIPDHVVQREDSDIRAPETRSVIAIYLDRVADLSAKLQCVENEHFDAITVAFLVNALDSRKSRELLFSFLNNATLDVWYCLDEVASKPVGSLTPIDSLQNGCSSHDYNCTLIKTTEDTKAEAFVNLLSSTSHVASHVIPHAIREKRLTRNVPYLDLCDRVKAMNTIAAIRRRRRRVAENNRKLAAGACDRCKARKLVCIESRPGLCERCQTKNLPCRFQRNNASSRQNQTSVNNDSASSLTSPAASQGNVHGNSHETESTVWPRYLNRLREAFSLDSLSSVEEQDVVTSRIPTAPPTRPSSSERVRLTKVVDSLPPRAVAHFLLSVCIKHGADVFFYFDQAQIISELDQFYAGPSCPLRSDPSFVCLVLATFALGSNWTHLERPESSTDMDERDAGVMFFQQASSLMPDIADDNGLRSIQACFVLSVYLMPLKDMGSSCIYLSMALRKALAFGLHQNPQDGSLEARELETRRRLWWSIYSLERSTTTDDARPDKILSIEARLKEWKDSLPEGFHLDAISPQDSRYHAVLNLYLNYYYTRIIMGKASLVEIVRKTLRYHLGHDAQPWDIEDTTERLARSCKRASRKLLRLFAGLDQIRDTTRLPFAYFQGCSIAVIVTLIAGILGRDFGYQQRINMGLSCLRRMASGIPFAEMGVKLVESLQSLSDEASRKLSLSRQPAGQSQDGHSLSTPAYTEWTEWLASQNGAISQPWIQGAEGVVDPFMTRLSMQQQVHSDLPETSHSITGCDDGQLFLMSLTGLSALDFVGVAPDVEQ
ncbi:hypothetical protein FGRMN_5874 [Fusarium graminum]|nr:hypothetical protein FGRMN_5874 [Fusarium graminum]